MAGGRTPWAVVTVIVLAATVAAGALVGAAALGERVRSEPAEPTATTGPGAPTVGVDGCQDQQCRVLAVRTIGGSTVELVADAGAHTGRLRIGGSSTGRVIELNLADLGVTMNRDSLRCVSGVVSACLVHGVRGVGTGGQVVVGRSDKWRATEKRYISDAGYLALANVTIDSGPEVIAVQRRCPSGRTCASSSVFAQVFALNGTELGCTVSYRRLESLPGFPDVRLTAAGLRPCG